MQDHRIVSTKQLEDENRHLQLVNFYLSGRKCELSSMIRLLQSQAEPNFQSEYVLFLANQMQQLRADFDSEKQGRIKAEERVKELEQQLAGINMQMQDTAEHEHLLHKCISCGTFLLECRHHNIETD